MLAKLTQLVDEQLGANLELYKSLHENPEISLQEKNTSDRLISELEAHNFNIIKNLWGYGFVGVLENGSGPALMIRTDLDALPILEKTTLPFKSKKKTILNSEEVPTMHACGHDLHMTVFTGVAKIMSQLKKIWSGTLYFVGQPAEEIGQGAKKMIEAGLFDKVKTPDAIFAYHIAPKLPSGEIGYTKGYCFANVDMLDLTIHGIGGHGALPNETIDPIVIASKIILSLQTIVSRKISPLEPAVISVGSIHGGFNHNIIPSEVKLEITTRSYSEENRTKILNLIKETAEGIALSEGIPEELNPEMFIRDSYTPSVFNNHNLVDESIKALSSVLGEKKVYEIPPEMIGEDFSWFGKTDKKIPIFMMRLGSTSAKVIDEYRRIGKKLPGLHSPYLAPDIENTINTGIKGLTSILLNKLKILEA